MLKLHTTILAMVLMTGMVAAQPTDADLPNAGMTPGNLFYGLERASEKLELAVASSPVIGSEELAAKVRANHAAERLSEAKKLADRNKTEKVQRLIDQYSDSMNRSVQLARKSGKPEFAQRLKNVSRNQVQVLERKRERVPEQARKGIETAIENSRKNREELDIPEQARDPGRKEKSNNRVKDGLNITVEDRAPGKEPGDKSDGKTAGQTLDNRSGRIELGRLSTEEPDNSGNGSGPAIQDSENRVETQEPNDPLQ